MNITKQLHLVPVISDASIDPASWPVITPTPQLEAEVDEDVILQCTYNRVQKTSLLLIDWYKISKTWANGSPITDASATHIWESRQNGQFRKEFGESGYQHVNQGIPIASGHIIKIVNVTLQSEGMYACIVQPEFGNKQGDAVINVTVLGKYSSG